jgi:hypothetical protein
MSIVNGLNPNLKGVSFTSGTAYITGGVATGTAAIIADVKANLGEVANGSVYVSTAGNGELWILVSGTWTKLTIN